MGNSLTMLSKFIAAALAVVAVSASVLDPSFMEVQGLPKCGEFRDYCKTKTKQCSNEACCNKYWTVSEDNDDCRMCSYITTSSGKKRCGLDKASSGKAKLCQGTKKQAQEAANAYGGWEGGFQCGTTKHDGEEN